MHRLDAYRALASSSRVHILAVLQEADGPMPVDDLAAAVGLHVNTAREHLDRLHASGFVERQVEERHVRGRPRLLYRAVDVPDAGVADHAATAAHEQLTRLLVDGFGREMASPAHEAEEAGRRWALSARTAATSGRQAEADAAGGSRDDGADGLAALVRQFAALGFDASADAGTLEVHLRGCPIRDVARARADVVCGLHLGLARGVLEQGGDVLEVAALEPFVAPEHCVLRLARR